MSVCRLRRCAACRSAAVWDDPDEFRPERFPLDDPIPTETNTDFRCAVLAWAQACAVRRMLCM
jgi:cytochrome P450